MSAIVQIAFKRITGWLGTSSHQEFTEKTLHHLDIDSDGQVEITTWVAPDTDDAFLYLDRNANGIVDNALELFGNRTLLVDGSFADHGYQALAEFDLPMNGGFNDGQISDLDEVFDELRVWIDSNADGICEPHETKSIAEVGVISLSLEFTESPRTDPHGNRFFLVSRGWIESNGQAKKLWTADVAFVTLSD